jgi:chorismate dehydratase
VPASDVRAVEPSGEPFRIACVSFVNARPLIDGLDSRDDVRLMLDVPSRMLDALESKRAEVALLPTIDLLHRADRVRMLPVAGIGCDGPTLTVRLFSRSPIESTRVLACDGDSHTSIALARIVLRKRFAIDPELIPLARASDRPFETRLLIGDKVVCEPPADMPHQLDLGDAWKQLTGLPFVFAVWATRCDIEPARIDALTTLLEDSLRRGLQNIDAIIQNFAIPRGWPPALARQYLTRYLHYDIGRLAFDGIEEFQQRTLVQSTGDRRTEAG